MNARNIKHSDGKGESFAVSRHIILKNFWEYYVEEPDENGITFGFVMGFENEWGSVDYNEIKPYIISEAKGTALDEVMPPAGYVWEDEDDDGTNWWSAMHSRGRPKKSPVTPAADKCAPAPNGGYYNPCGRGQKDYDGDHYMKDASAVMLMSIL